MRIILDTGVLWRPVALRRLARTAHDVVVPAVAFLERARQLLRRGRAPEEFLQWLRENEFIVEPFGTEEGLRYGSRVTEDAAWRRLARDSMIAGHVREEDVLWTTNPQDFIEIGVPEVQVFAVA